MDKISKLKYEECHDFNSLLSIMELLRAENGCPWDREQTHDSIRQNFIEETYEVVEAIDKKDAKLLCEELGDVILQVVFHAQMEKETGSFTIDDVLNGICTKLISRHPHIFGDVKVKDSDEVLKNWDAIKSDEKKRLSVTDKMRSVPAMLPALMRAEKIGEKAAKVGFDFENIQTALDKVYEETDEVRMTVSEQSGRENEEIGDLLFSAVNAARLAGVEPEQALNRATDKFINRFEKIEKNVTSKGREMSEMTMRELDCIWDDIKAEECEQKE